jgi:hypothetical protein
VTRSLILGEGDSLGVESERERPLEGLALAGVVAAAAAVSRGPSVAGSTMFRPESPKELLSIAAMTERPSPGASAPGGRLRGVSMSASDCCYRGGRGPAEAGAWNWGVWVWREEHNHGNGSEEEQ